jgi:hypothetical protein
MFQWRTPGLTGRLNEQMIWSLMLWRNGYTGQMISILGDGWRSYQPWSRDWGPKLVTIPTSPYTSWSLALRLCYQLTLLSSHHGSRTMMRRGRPRLESLRLIAPRNTTLTPACTRLNICRTCVGTITIMSRIDSSWLTIWLCKGSRRQKDCIS